MVISCCVGVAEDHDEVLAALAGTRSAGLPIEHGANVAGATIVVAFVGTIDADATWRLREIAASSQRLLAILVGPREANDTTSPLAAGASDVLVWRGDAAAVVSRLERWIAIEELLEAPLVRDNLVGDSYVWRRTLRNIVEIARFTNASMLLSGESGTGKELVARLVHTLDARADKGQLVVLDCTTIVPTLSGSEFFGHERGAFTGAVGARDGAFALAHQGTLFLDEVADLPLPLQAQLLRVIQERTFKRVGGNDWQQADFRLVCASHRDLATAVREGAFRHDLYHRIATWTFRLPSLADRRDDIPALVRHFVQVHRPDDRVELDPVVETFLAGRPYPGNIRELRHTVQRLLDRCPGDGRITVGQIPESERDGLFDGARTWPDDAFEAAVRDAVTAGVGLKGVRKAAEDLAVQIALALEQGSVAKASRRLGVTERALQLRQAARREQADGEDAN
jgi:transcriptional regulator with GAF, ATPase, and Fis domain